MDLGNIESVPAKMNCNALMHLHYFCDTTHRTHHATRSSIWPLPFARNAVQLR